MTRVISLLVLECLHRQDLPQGSFGKTAVAIGVMLRYPAAVGILFPFLDIGSQISLSEYGAAEKSLVLRVFRMKDWLRAYEKLKKEYTSTNSNLFITFLDKGKQNSVLFNKHAL